MVATKPGSSVPTTYGVKLVSTFVPNANVSGTAPMGSNVVMKLRISNQLSRGSEPETMGPVTRWVSMAIESTPLKLLSLFGLPSPSKPNFVAKLRSRMAVAEPGVCSMS